MNILPRKFYKRETVVVARDLLGKKIVRTIDGHKLVGIISETEAYRSDDPASHAFIGKTERNKSLFGEVGHAYVYMNYGLHYALNFVARDPKFEAGGVLIRQVIPIEGYDIMHKFRPISNDALLSNGPGKLTQAFNITKKQNGVDLTDPRSEIIVTEGIPVTDEQVKISPRIGISRATDKLWNFTLLHKKYLS